MVQRTPCLDLSAEMNGFITAMADLPPGSSMRSGTMHATSAHNELHLTMRESQSGTITPLAADAR
jgi:hypothetical protein